MSDADLRVYSRPDCHLCDALLAALEPLCHAAGKSVRVIDVDSSPTLARRYGLDIPVVSDGDTVIMKHQFDRKAWDDWLAGRH